MIRESPEIHVATVQSCTKPKKIIDTITGGAVMPLEVIVVICLRYVMETRGVDVEERRSYRVIIFPLPFYTVMASHWTQWRSHIE
ncbi:hypothetical protein Bca4012_049070 [Brassica carinata]